MPSRGFIIAIENYAKIEEGFASRLEGTRESGLKFRKWLIETKGVKPENIIFCTDTPIEGITTAGASCADITAELDHLAQVGKDRTDQLYFFYCGHGFTVRDPDGKQRVDVIVCDDFRNARVSGNACLKLDEVQWFLRLALGRQQDDHYFFIDACRTQLSPRDINVGGSGLSPLNSSTLGEPSSFTLYSTRPGDLAAVASDFPDALIDGLNGKGRAKAWSDVDRDAMVVLFNQLADYVKTRLTDQSVTFEIYGERNGTIRFLKPPPTYTCRILVEDGARADQFDFVLEVGRQHGHLQSDQFTGPVHELPPRPPDDYYLTLRCAAAPCANMDPLPISLYEDCEVRFQKSGRVAQPAPIPLVPLNVKLPPGASVKVRNVATGHSSEFVSSGLQSLLAGRYMASLRETETDTPLEKREFALESGQPQELDFAGMKLTEMRETLLTNIHGEETGGLSIRPFGGPPDGGAVLSQLLAETPDQDLGLWLALVGASRILGEEDDELRFHDLPLQRFGRLPRGHCTFYFLAAFDDPAIVPHIGITTPATTEWMTPTRIESIPGLYELTLPPQPYGQYRPIWGPWRQPLFSFAGLGHSTATFTSCLSPNRVTLITLTTDENSQLQIGQFLLPPQHLWRSLPMEVTYALHWPDGLRSIKTYAQSQRLFRQRRALFVGARNHQLSELLHLKWIDPITAVMATYELIRRNERNHLLEVADNLYHYFPEVPDTHAIRRLVDGSGDSSGIPLFLDGLRAFPGLLQSLPFPAANLDFQNPWMLWRDVVMRIV